MAQDKLRSFVERNSVVLYGGIGVGIYRCIHEWAAWLSSSFGKALLPPPFFAVDYYLLIDAGKVVGVAFFLFFCYAFDKKGRSSALRILPSVVLVAGFLCPLLLVAGLPIGNAATTASLVAVGIGVGMLCVQWIELGGLVSPGKVAQAIAVSYLVRFALLPTLIACGPLLGSALIMLLAGTAFLQVSLGYTRLPVAETWTRTMPGRRDVAGFAGLFLWVAVFAFAYGLGVSSTHLAHSSFEAGLGKALPALFTLAISVKLGDNFNRSALYAVALPLMTAGLIGVTFLNATPSLSQVLLSAAMASFRLLAFVEVCAFAYRSRTSAMLLGGCVRVLALISADAAVSLALLDPFWNQGVVITAVILIAIFVGSLVYLPRISSRREQHRLPFEREGLEEAALSAGLTQRETTVFHLLVMGKTATEISNELFISNGAVRAHSSRIYDKFGVHSREDFSALFPANRT